MNPEPLASCVDRELGAVPAPLLDAQAARWQAFVAAGASRPTRSRALPLALALAALLGLLVLGVALGRRAPAVAVAPSAAAGNPADEVSNYDFTVAAGDAPLRVELAPEEILSVSPGSRGQVQRSPSTTTASITTQVTLSSGSLSLAVPPDTGRKWAVSAGPYRVEVVGTDFSVTWLPDPAELTVIVRRGKVRVSGGELTEERVLAAGEQLEQRPRPRDAATTATSPAPRPSVAPPLTWQTLQQRRQYHEALSAAEREGFDQLCATLGADELATLADTARLAGNGARARQALLAIRQRHPQTPEAATAAFLLGRQGSSAAHAAWLETYLREQPDGAYAQEASGRLMVGLRSSGALESAKARAKLYLARYPDGAYAEHARSILGGEESPVGSR